MALDRVSALLDIVLARVVSSLNLRDAEAVTHVRCGATCNFHNAVGAHPLSYGSVCSVIRAGQKSTGARVLKHRRTDFETLQHES